MSPFIVMPAGLPNDIHKYISSYTPTIRPPNSNGQLIRKSTLLTNYMQTREEYQDALHTCAPIIDEVTGFKFWHVVAFLNKFSDRELNRLPALYFTFQDCQRSTHQMLVQINITHKRQPNSERRQRFIFRYEYPIERGKCLDMKCVTDFDMYQPNIEPWVQIWTPPCCEHSSLQSIWKEGEKFGGGGEGKGIHRTGERRECTETSAQRLDDRVWMLRVLVCISNTTFSKQSLLFPYHKIFTDELP